MQEQQHKVMEFNDRRLYEKFQSLKSQKKEIMKQE